MTLKCSMCHLFMCAFYNTLSTDTYRTNTVDDTFHQLLYPSFAGLD